MKRKGVVTVKGNQVTIIGSEATAWDKALDAVKKIT
jgi:hypothetical protein